MSVSSKTCRVLFALALSLMMPLAAGCSGGQQAQPSEQAEQKPVEQESAEQVKDDEKAPAETDAKDGASSADSVATTSGKRVGADGIGFVTVPDTWVEFHDVDGNSSIQWCADDKTIISLNTFDVNSLPEDMREGFTAEDAANVVWNNMIYDDGAKEEDVQGARVTLAGREALQVYAYFPDASYLVCWLLQDDAGVIRYVSAEGTEASIMEAVSIVQDTYEL